MSRSKKSKPFVKLQYDVEDHLEEYTEVGVVSGAKLDPSTVDDPDVLRIYNASHEIDRDLLWPWLLLNKKEWSDTTILVDTDNGDDLLQYKDRHPRMIYSHRKLNLIRHLNTFLNRANEVLEDGGYIMLHARTAAMKRELIYSKYPGFLGKVAYYTHYLWHRVCPKLKLTKWLYFAITKGKNRTYHRVEIMGRMYRAGFDVVDEGFRYGEFFVLGRKRRSPIWDDEPSCGPLIKLLRVGKDGNLIGVYKFRTMYSYSEYLQPYMLAHEGLQDGGKFAHDYRVNGWGKLLRKSWLDELPMFINLFKGQMKLVGVRPLSRHYFSLYTPEMQALRITVKPGLLPPFYYEAESPVTLDDVQASERRYIEAYHQHPFRTDWRYFWGTVGNILFKHKRSN